jgi:hypothetical protein
VANRRVAELTVNAVPAREDHARKVAELAGAELLLVKKPVPQERLLAVCTAFENAHARALESGASWCCVLEDDVILCRDFRFRFDLRCKEAASLKFHLVTFYSGRKLNPPDKGKRWRPRRGTFHGSQCIAVRTSGVPSMTRYVRGTFNPECPWIDMKISEYAKAFSLSVAECLPNLVDHDLSVKSTLGHPSKAGGVPCNSKSFRENAK